TPANRVRMDPRSSAGRTARTPRFRPRTRVLGLSSGMSHVARRSFIVPALTLAATLLSAVVWAAQAPPPTATNAGAKPNLTGTYAFVQKRSDDLKEAIGKAVGPDYTLNNKKSEQARVWIHSWLEGITADQDKLVLTLGASRAVF